MKTQVKRKPAGNGRWGKPKEVVTPTPITNETQVMEENIEEIKQTVEETIVESPKAKIDFTKDYKVDPIGTPQPKRTLNHSTKHVFRIEEDKVYEFELCDSYPNAKPVDKNNGKSITSPYPPTWIEPNEGVSFDEEYDNGENKPKGRARAWRLIDGQPSIWVDEQPSLENLEKQQIYQLLGEAENQLHFKEGKLLVRGIEKLKIQALMIQDAFEGKRVQYRTKSRRYRLNNPDVDVSESLKASDLEFQAMKLAHEADEEDMIRGAYTLGINVDDRSASGMNKIRSQFIAKAKPDPANPKGIEFFIKIMTSPITKITYIFSRGIAEGLISTSQQPGKLTWAHMNTAILDIDPKMNPVNQLTALAVNNNAKVLDLFDELEIQLNNL